MAVKKTMGQIIYDLLIENNVQQKDLCDYCRSKGCKCGEATISDIINDKEKGYDYRTIKCIAEYFGVSLDYLINNTDIQSPDPYVKISCDYTGLSEKAVSNLHNIIKKSSEQDLSDDFAIRDLSKQFIDYLLSNNDLFAISALISECCSFYQLSNEALEALIEFNDLSAFSAAKDRENRARVARYEAIEYFTKCIDSFVDSDGLKQKNSELLNKSTAQFHKIVEELEKEGVE